MAKQRGHGEGSIYQRNDGRWVASITLENRKRKYFYGKTRREVQEQLKAALHEQQQGTLATGPRQPLTKEQAQKLLQTAKGHPLEALITLAVATGMRKGELLGLKWGDVNLDAMSLQVRRTVDKVSGKYMENEPKTAKSRRKIVLPQFVVDVLKQH